MLGTDGLIVCIIEKKCFIGLVDVDSISNSVYDQCTGAIYGQFPIRSQ